MAQKSWHLNRRTFLTGSGAVLGLPYLEGMASAGAAKEALPARLFCAYFPFGIVNLPETDPNAMWNWWPMGSGKDYRFSNTLKPLEPHRGEVTFFQGFQHDRVKVPGHSSADYFLTGADTRTGSNAISLDQAAAAHLGDTRIPSLVLSTDGGVGAIGTSHTLSYTPVGRPVPALANPAEIFEKVFGSATPAIRRQMALERSVLDLVLESSHSLDRQLGAMDRRTLNEYLESVRTLETDAIRAQSWFDTTREAVKSSDFSLKAVAENDPRTYLRVIYDLVFHAFRTDTTRIATYQTGNMHGTNSVAHAWPQYLGTGGRHAHTLAHSAQREPEPKSRYDAALLEPLARLIARLKESREGESTLLDRTLLFYGSSNSRTHQNSNYPLVLAGGRGLGIRHGRYLKNTRSKPLADIFFTMLQALGVPAKSFADSTGPLADLRS